MGFLNIGKKFAIDMSKVDSVTCESNAKKIADMARKSIEDTLDIDENALQSATPETSENSETKEEWIWVDGYKGTDKNMQCKNNFQYEIGKTYTCDEDIKLCYNGFHFCRDLDDVFEYISIFYGNRFFKVKGLIRKEDFEKYGTTEYVPASHYNYGYISHNKLVAKEITIEEEISKEEKFECFKKIMNYMSKDDKNRKIIDAYKFLESIDDMEEFLEDSQTYKFKKAFSILSTIGICDSLCTILSDKITFEKAQFALALREQNISMDMLIYLVLNYKE